MFRRLRRCLPPHCWPTWMDVSRGRGLHLARGRQQSNKTESAFAKFQELTVCGSLIIEKRTVDARSRGDLSRDLRQRLVSVDDGVKSGRRRGEGHGRRPRIVFIHTGQLRSGQHRRC